MKENKTFYIQTFGCQMNERDSETIAGILSQKGYFESENKEDATVVVINTCSVRDNADQRFFGTLGQFKKSKEKALLENRDYVVCICGCMMQQQHIVDAIKESYPWVDIVFGTHNIQNFPELLENTLSQSKRRAINAKGGIFEIFDDTDCISENLPSKRMYSYKAYVTIMYGCNNFCTYCIVPYTRGREKSRAKNEIIKEINELVENGCKEITLLGQNVNSYLGKASDGEKKNNENCSKECVGENAIEDAQLNFPQLIDAIENETKIERLRFMTSHPKDLSDDLIDTYKVSNVLCDSIHLPVQSGSSRILDRMNRKYTKEKYIDLINKIRKVKPDISISTDIIVGFPGETEEDFLETLDLVKSVEFDSAFTFIYSVRKGTPAENYSDQIPEEIKHERFNRLVDAINSSSEKKNKERIGKIEKVLVEGLSKTNKNYLTGRSSQFKTVNFSIQDIEEDLAKYIGEIVNVEITDANTFSLFGKINCSQK